MRRIIPIITILFLTACASSGPMQIQQNASGAFEHQEVVEVEGVSAEQIFDRSKEWIALNYRSANDVIQMEDPDEGIIIGKGYFPVNLFLKQGEVRHTVRLEARENRFRITFNRLAYYSSGSGEIPFEDNMAGKSKVVNTTAEKIDETIRLLTNKIQEPDSDW